MIIIDKKKIKKITKVSVAGLLAFSLGAGTTYTIMNYNTSAASTATAKATAVTTNDNDTTTSSSSSHTDTYKDETVYVVQNTNGSASKIIVSDWLENVKGKDSLEDVSNLTDITNTKGDETYEADGNKLTWDAEGNDIYYQGYSDKQLPVTMKVTYKLDGKTISADDLAGKSGKVTIHIDYTNNATTTATINGKKETLNIPFIALSGTMLDGDKFKNVEVSNGKVLNTGDNYVVMGFALPGLNDDLNLDSIDLLKDEDIEIPESVEFSADVEDFELTTIGTVVTNQFDSDADFSAVDSLDDLKDQMKQLDDGAKQLVDGTSDLYDGMSQLLEKSGDLVKGVDQLDAGAQQILDGTASLNDGASQVNEGAASLATGAESLEQGIESATAGISHLYTGSQTLTKGLETLVGNNKTINNGMAQLYSSVVSNANDQLDANEDLQNLGITYDALTTENYDEVLEGIINDLEEDESVYAKASAEAEAQVRAQVYSEANQAQIEAAVTAAVKQQVTQQVTATVQSEASKALATVTDAVQASVEAQVVEAVASSQGMTATQYYALEQAVEAGTATDTQKATYNALSAVVSSKVEEQMATSEVQEAIASNLLAQINAKYSISATSLEEAEETLINANVEQQMESDTVKALIEQNVKQQSEYLVQSNMASDAVTSQIKAKLNDGADTILEAKAQLDQVGALVDGIQTYTAGVESAYKGSIQITEGLSDLNDGSSLLLSGSKQLATGAETLAGGTSQLADGTEQLESGASTLKDGTSQLKDGTSTLISGEKKLKDGSLQISDGMQKLYDEGISKIVDTLGGDELADITDRLQAIVDATKDYDSYSGKAKGMDGNVKFIYRTDEIKK